MWSVKQHRQLLLHSTGGHNNESESSANTTPLSERCVSDPVPDAAAVKESVCVCVLWFLCQRASCFTRFRFIINVESLREKKSRIGFQCSACSEREGALWPM